MNTPHSELAPDGYCNVHGWRGLTCDKKNLALLRVLREEPEERYYESIYRCEVCRGLYKYISSSIYQNRNFDCEAGWQELLDNHFKVEERYATCIPFPREEARYYGYNRDHFPYAPDRCRHHGHSGLTCAAGDVLRMGYLANDISKCVRCGQFYKQVWFGAVRYYHYKPGEEREGRLPFTLEAARKLGYRD